MCSNISFALKIEGEGILCGNEHSRVDRYKKLGALASSFHPHK